MPRCVHAERHPEKLRRRFYPLSQGCVEARQHPVVVVENVNPSANRSLDSPICVRPLSEIGAIPHIAHAATAEAFYKLLEVARAGIIRDEDLHFVWTGVLIENRVEALT